MKTIEHYPTGDWRQGKAAYPQFKSLLVWYLLLLDACGLDVLFTVVAWRDFSEGH